MIPDFSRCKVLVIGDVMLDRYIRGICTRVSPEAPVPVISVNSPCEEVLGGAGNLAANLSALHCQVSLLASVGSTDQSNSSSVWRLVRSAGVFPYLRASSHRTTVKTRIIANRQQVARVDEDGIASHFDSEWVRDAIMDSPVGLSAIILSDYGKGVLTPAACKAAIRSGVPVFVDPKDGDWTKYAGAYGIKPNKHELARWLGRPLPEDAGEIQEILRQVSSRLGISCVLLTLGSGGMVLYHKRLTETLKIPAEEREVYDLSGAGDTALSAFVAAFSQLCADTPSAVDLEEGLWKSLEIANRAAGISVSKPGTSVVSAKELL